MRNIIKRKNPNICKYRKQFKKDLEKEMHNNDSLAISIINTYIAIEHRKHINEICFFLGNNYPIVYKDYCNLLFGKQLSGEESIWKTLHFSNCGNLLDKYKNKIPTFIALGDSLNISYKYIHLKYFK